MNQTLLFLALLIFSLCKVHGVDTYFPCGGCDWLAYEGEKCLKFINKLVTYDEAEKICNQENLQNNPFIPTLVSIKSAIEQDYLTKYIFDLSGVVDDVWIGAKRQAINQFVWNDGSNLDFANWAEGNPFEDAERSCTVMKSNFTREFFNMSDFDKSTINGKWANVPCNKKNMVLCQKLQIWSLPVLQKKFLDTRKQLSDSLEEVRNQLQNSNEERKRLKDSLENITNELNNHQKTINSQQSTINNLQLNPVPLGFIYVQLGNQTEPKTIWPEVEWMDVSNEYAGLFFRTIGGNSAKFEEIQEQNFPAISVSMSCCEEKDYLPWVRNSVVPKNGDSSQYIILGSDTGRFHIFSSFKYSSDEVRPRNQAVRIWKRIK